VGPRPQGRAMTPLKRAKVQVNAIISMCILFVPGRLRRARERVRNARSVHEIAGPPAPRQHGFPWGWISCRPERTVA
jgi:hypothetical protein